MDHHILTVLHLLNRFTHQSLRDDALSAVKDLGDEIGGRSQIVRKFDLSAPTNRDSGIILTY